MMRVIRVIDVFKQLDLHYPVKVAQDFDNVGILVGNAQAEVKRILVTLDCTLSAVNKAVEIGADLIVTHHPVIFRSLKSVTDNSVIIPLIKNNIAVISMHTNFDVGLGGVNDILCAALQLKNVKKFVASDGYLLNSATTDISSPDRLADSFKSLLGFPVRYVAGRPIKNLLVCSGSGGGFLSEAISKGFDALITADVKHNQFVEAYNNNISLFDCGHYATENICVKPLAVMISDAFPTVEKVEIFEPDFIKFN